MPDSEAVKHFSIFFTALLFVCLLCPPVMAQPEDPWAPRPICIFGMPYLGEAVMPGGKGLLVDLLKEVFDPENILLEHEPMPYVRALEGVREGTIHCTMDVHGRNPKLEAKMTPALYRLSVAHLRTTEFKDIKSMEGTRVAYVHGFDSEQFLPVKIKTQLVYDLSSGFHMLANEHVSFVLGDMRLLKDAMFDSKIPPAIFTITPLKTLKSVLLFAPTKEGQFFRDVYDRRMKTLFKNGTFERIMLKYGNSKKMARQVIEAN